MEVKTIREGGVNDRQIRLTGPATYGQLTLKRGMTDGSFELWNWFERQHRRSRACAPTPRWCCWPPTAARSARASCCRAASR